MNPDEIEFATADELHTAAEEMPPKPPLRIYRATMDHLRTKGYSYQEIADWLSQQLGVPVKRAQVSYLLTTPSQVLEADEEAEEIEDRMEGDVQA